MGTNTKSFELKLGKTGFIILIAGMAVILFVSFLYGVYVGKNIDTYPEKIASYPRKLLAYVWRPAKIKAQISEQETKVLQSGEKNQEDLDLTFYDTLASKKGLAKERLISEKKPTVEPEPPPLVEGQNKNAPEATVVRAEDIKSKELGSGVEPRENKKKAAVQPVKPNAAVAVKFSLQAASLKDKAKANLISRKIATLGYKPRVAQAEIKGKGTWFRVVVDGFTSQKQADIAAARIAKTTKTKCLITRVNSAAAGTN